MWTLDKGSRSYLDELKPIRWAGTFHSIANRLLRIYAESLGLAPTFTILDRADAEDLLNRLRDERGFSRASSRFPKKATCLAIYSRVVNMQRPLAAVLATAFPWCERWAGELKALFGAYLRAKQDRQVADYDDLLLYWHQMMTEAALAPAASSHIRVDVGARPRALWE